MAPPTAFSAAVRASAGAMRVPTVALAVLDARLPRVSVSIDSPALIGGTQVNTGQVFRADYPERSAIGSDNCS